MSNTVMLKNGKWTAEIAPEVGGNIVALRCDGKDILRPLDVHKELPERITQYGATILFPVNRTIQGRFTFNGETYQLPQDPSRGGDNMHGSVYLQAFQLVSCDETSAVVSIESQGELYPFPFRLTVTYTLIGNGVSAVYRVENLGETAMPFTLGMHTTFPEPEVFRVDIEEIQERGEDGRTTGRYLPLSPEEKELAEKGGVSRGRSLIGFYRASGKIACLDDTVVYEAVRGFDHWTVFNRGGNAGILCIEPQCGAVNGLNMPGGHRVLQPGEATELEWRIYLK